MMKSTDLQAIAKETAKAMSAQYSEWAQYFKAQGMSEISINNQKAAEFYYSMSQWDNIRMASIEKMELKIVRDWMPKWEARRHDLVERIQYLQRESLKEELVLLEDKIAQYAARVRFLGEAIDDLASNAVTPDDFKPMIDCQQTTPPAGITRSNHEDADSGPLFKR